MTLKALRAFTVGSEEVDHIDEFKDNEGNVVATHQVNKVVTFEEGDTVPESALGDNVGDLLRDGFVVETGGAKQTASKKTAAKRTVGGATSGRKSGRETSHSSAARGGSRSR